MIANQPVRTIYLRGELGRQFGRVHRLAVASPAEAVRALCVLCKGFRDFLMTSDQKGLEYKVLVGREAQSVEELTMAHGPQKTYSFVPVLTGAKKQGAAQTIVGVVLVVVGVILTGVGNPLGSALMKFGGALIVGGVMQMLTPLPQAPKPEEKDGSRPGAYFNGAVNTTMQGQPVPICYGELAVGSAVIGAGLRADRVNV